MSPQHVENIIPKRKMSHYLSPSFMCLSASATDPAIVNDKSSFRGLASQPIRKSSEGPAFVCMWARLTFTGVYLLRNHSNRSENRHEARKDAASIPGAGSQACSRCWAWRIGVVLDSQRCIMRRFFARPALPLVSQWDVVGL
jgi:hypothetical protein